MDTKSLYKIDKTEMVKALIRVELQWFLENGADSDIEYLIDYFKDLFVEYHDNAIYKLYVEKFSD